MSEYDKAYILYVIMMTLEIVLPLLVVLFFGFMIYVTGQSQKRLEEITKNKE